MPKGKWINGAIQLVTVIEKIMKEHFPIYP